MTDTPFVRYPHAARPRVGLDTAVVMDHAVVALADRRFMVALDAPVQLHLLASLVARAETWLGEQIAAARAAGASWTTIGRLLGLTAAVARPTGGCRWSTDANHLNQLNNGRRPPRRAMPPPVRSPKEPPLDPSTN